MKDKRSSSIRVLAMALFALLAACVSDDEAPYVADGSKGGGPRVMNPNAFSSALSYVQLSGGAVDMAAGPEPGSLWVLGTNDVFGGKAIYHSTDYGATWVNVWGGGVAIDVGPQDDPWHVNNVGEIYRWLGGTWQRMPGQGKDIGVGADGTAWMVGEPAVNGGYSIYRWRGDEWENIPGGATRIDVGPDGKAWITNIYGQIFHYNGGGWDIIPGGAIDVGVGAEGTAFIVGTDRALYRRVFDEWSYFPVVADRVAVDGNGVPYFTNPYNSMFRQNFEPPAGGVVAGAGNLDCSFNRRAVAEFCLQTYHGKFVSAREDLTVRADGAACGPWERIRLEPPVNGAVQNGAPVSLRGWKGTYLGAQPDGTTHADARVADSWESFTLEGSPTPGGTVRLRSNAFGKYMVAEADGALNTNRDVASVWETFTLVTPPGPTSPNTYDISCRRNGQPLLAVTGLQGVVRGTFDFSLSARVGNTARQLFGNYASLVSFLDSNVLNGLDNALVRLDGQYQGDRVSVASTVGLGAGFDDIDAAAKDMFGVSPKALKPYVRAEMTRDPQNSDNNQVAVTALLNEGAAPFSIEQTGTSFQLRSLRLDYQSSKGAKALSVVANTKIKPTSADVWVPTLLTVTRDFNEKKTTATARLTGWTKPLGYSKLDVNDATFGAEFFGGKLSAYLIDITQATARASDGAAYTLSGAYALDRKNGYYAFELATNEVPVLLALDMLAPSDSGLYPVLQSLNLHQTKILGYNGQPARIVLSPTGGTILGRTYEKKSSIYGKLDARVGAATIPAIVDSSGVVERENGKFVVKDFRASMQIDLNSFLTEVKANSSNVGADVLNTFSVKTVALNVARVDNKWSGGASATLRVCGQDNLLDFDTNNVPKMITDSAQFLVNIAGACINNAGCFNPAYPDKGGALCYPTCNPGYHSDGATQCIQNCPAGSSAKWFFGYYCEMLGNDFAACPAGFKANSKKPYCYVDTYSRGAGVPLSYPN